MKNNCKNIEVHVMHDLTKRYFKLGMPCFKPTGLLFVLFLSVLTGLAKNARATVTLPQVIGHNMVLQRDKPVHIWGSAAPMEEVTVRFRGHSVKTITDADGHWLVSLPPMHASSKDADMVIAGSNTIVLHHILTGEVWLCSGQSNMEYTMRKNSKVASVAIPKGFNHSPVDELQYANNDQIRIFLGLRKPMAKVHPDHEGWSVAKDSALRQFSAAAYFFARKLYKTLHVPIGMIANAIPGSAIEPWLAGKITAIEPASDALYFDYSKPGKFYPTLVRPLAPFTIRGFLWYQGETNCFMNDSLQYAYKMQALIDQWRTQWGDSTLPFYYVQIAPFYYAKNKGDYPLDIYTLPKFWEAQALCLQIPHTGMTVSTDLPDNLNNIHPPGKWVVGERLAAIALAKTYGRSIAYSGPTYVRSVTAAGKMELYFTNRDGGLVSKDGKPLTYFELSGPDGKYYPAKAIIQGDHIELTSKDVARPVAARFAWTESAQPNFYNKAGFPAMAFRTDNPYKHRHILLQ
jgi:sialate O-acetylesterase